MKAIRETALFQKSTQLALEVTGQTFAVAVALFLVLAWILTGPIFHLCDRYLRRKNGKQWKMKGAL